MCSWLTVPEALLVSTHVLKRPGLKIPWPKLQLWRDETCAAALELAQVAQLDNLSASVTANSVDVVRCLAKHASKVSFHLIRNMFLLDRICRGTFAHTTSLALQLAVAVPPGWLMPWLASFPALVELDLHLGAYTTPEDLASVLAPHRLRKLAIDSPGLKVAKALLDTIVDNMPELTSLDMNLLNLESPASLVVLERLTKLETCSFHIATTYVAGFMHRMNSWRTLRLKIRDNDFAPLHVPSGVRDFSCLAHFAPEANFLPNSFRNLEVRVRSLASRFGTPLRMLSELECLSLRVEAVDVSFLALVLPLLGKLRALTLEFASFEAHDYLNKSACCPSAEILTIKGLYYDDVDRLTWLRAFPNLRLLTLNSSDCVRVGAFRLLPKLERLVHTLGQDVVVVDRRPGGLIKRWRDQTVVLPLFI